jgi:hypothetical protein
MAQDIGMGGIPCGTCIAIITTADGSDASSTFSPVGWL